MILLNAWIKLQYVSVGWKQKKKNTKYWGKQTHKEQTNKQTGFVTKENDQTQFLRSANMTANEVGVQKEDKNRKISVGWGGRNLRTCRKTVRAFKTRTENKLNQEN